MTLMYTYVHVHVHVYACIHTGNLITAIELLVFSMLPCPPPPPHTHTHTYTRTHTHTRTHTLTHTEQKLVLGCGSNVVDHIYHVKGKTVYRLVHSLAYLYV